MQTNLLHKENAKVTKVLNFEERALGERARDHGSLERGNADESLAQEGREGHQGTEL
jgi:hypothetical protein